MPASSTRARISKRTVDAVEKPAAGEARLWDTDVRGFFLRVYPSDRRVYALKYRIGRLQRIHTLGTHGSPLTPEDAREAAKAALRVVADGKDPAEIKQRAKEALTVGQLIDRYLDEGPATVPAKRSSSWATDGTNLNCHIRHLLGRKMADQVTKAEAARAVRDIAEGRTARVEKTDKVRGRRVIKGGGGAARRTLDTAAAMFKWGITHELVASNPFASVKLPAAPKRERFLSRDEAGRVLDAIRDLEANGGLSNTFADAIRLLLLTGARKTEILGLRWDEIDVERRSLVLPPERTKAGGKTGERRVVLSPPALQILDRRRTSAAAELETTKATGQEASASPFVFPAAAGNRHKRGVRRGPGHAVGIRRPFMKVLELAKVPPARIHDARHTFASFAIADGASLVLVGKLLGHASLRTTERYAHLSNDPLADAAAAVGKKLMPVVEIGPGDPDVSAEPSGANVALLSERGGA